MASANGMSRLVLRYLRPERDGVGMVVDDEPGIERAVQIEDGGGLRITFCGTDLWTGGSYSYTTH